jgi:Transposase DNA-binding/Transposase DDE domain
MASALDPTPVLEELAEAFTDERLNERLATILRSMSRDPAASFPSVCSDAELEGAYRFFSNVRVTPEAILRPHFEATTAKARSEPRVLVVHDSTDFTFRTDGARKGLGRSRKSTQTFYGHFSLVLSADGARRPLGLAGVKTWVRGDDRSGTEHARWLEQIQSTDRTLGVQTGAIHVCDREADDYFTFHQLIASGTRFVIRAETKRWTLDAQGVRQKLASAMAHHEAVVSREAPISRRRAERSPTKAKTHPARAARVARLAVSATTLELTRPAHYAKRFRDRPELPPSLPLHVVRVWEPQPPPQSTPIEWFLYSNEPIATAQDLLDIVDHYRARWVIEEYFKALKTGCGYESRQLQDRQSLLNALAVTAPLAFQALRLRTLARTTPDAPASVVISDDQLVVLRALGRRKLPDQPSARDVLLAIAALGGHIKYAPDPGWLTIFRGYQKLELLTQGWSLAAERFQPHSDQR